MRNFRSGIGIAIAAALTMAVIVRAEPPAPTQPSSPWTPPPAPTGATNHPSSSRADAAYADMRQTLGMVPGFMKAFPEVGIAAAWDEFKALELNPNTAINAKAKELIGLAVAAQIPCHYCVYFHTSAARMNGATDQEIKEAIAIAAMARHWSTILSGMQIDEAAFKRDMTKAFARLKTTNGNGTAKANGNGTVNGNGNGKANADGTVTGNGTATVNGNGSATVNGNGSVNGKKVTDAAPPITDAASAFKDIERTLGFVPAFFRSVPDEAIGPAWREIKTVHMSADTALAPKIKDLIGLGVSAQVPCTYCIYFHTGMAKLNGATDRELKEAVAMAALTRHWSTVLNGSQIDEAQFRKEVDQLMTEAKKATTMREPAPAGR